MSYLITLEHAVNEVAQWTPEVLAAREVVLIDEQDVVLEAGVEMCLQAQLAHNWVVVAVDVCIDAVHALEYLADQ